MPRTFPRLLLLPLCILAHAGFAQAQQTPPSDAPPKLERIEPGSDVPATTLPPPGRTRITEKKQGGQVTEVEVQSGRSHYVMRPNAPPGNAQPGDAQSNAIRAPQWQVLEFEGVNRRGAVAAGQGEPATAEAPRPPAAPPPAAPPPAAPPPPPSPSRK